MWRLDYLPGAPIGRLLLCIVYRRAPGLHDVYTNLGSVLNELGRDDEAEKAFLTALKLRETPRR